MSILLQQHCCSIVCRLMSLVFGGGCVLSYSHRLHCSAVQCRITHLPWNLSAYSVCLFNAVSHCWGCSHRTCGGATHRHIWYELLFRWWWAPRLDKSIVQGIACGALLPWSYRHMDLADFHFPCSLFQCQSQSQTFQHNIMCLIDLSIAFVTTTEK